MNLNMRKDDQPQYNLTAVKAVYNAVPVTIPPHAGDIKVKKNGNSLRMTPDAFKIKIDAVMNPDLSVLLSKATVTGIEWRKWKKENPAVPLFLLQPVNRRLNIKNRNVFA
jgi:hypothetical protein